MDVAANGVIIGRSATSLPEYPGAMLLSVDDPGRSVSKNHALFFDRNGVLTVEDLKSTNGIVVTRSDGTELDPGSRGRVELDADSTVELGELRIRVRQLVGAGRVA